MKYASNAFEIRAGSLITLLILKDMEVEDPGEMKDQSLRRLGKQFWQLNRIDKIRGPDSFFAGVLLPERAKSMKYALNAFEIRAGSLITLLILKYMEVEDPGEMKDQSLRRLAKQFWQLNRIDKILGPDSLFARVLLPELAKSMKYALNASDIRAGSLITLLLILKDVEVEDTGEMKDQNLRRLDKQFGSSTA